MSRSVPVPGFRRRMAALLCIASLLGACGADAVHGTFRQKRFLKDVDVTLESSGTWSFEKDRSFEWRTVRPAPSVFSATPTNYSFTAGGRTVARNLSMQVNDIAKIFELKEMRDLVERVDRCADRPVFESGGVSIPSSVKVFFRNGDSLAIELELCD